MGTADRKPILVGANPGVRLFDGETLTAYASVWQVDWSTHGSGNAILLWRDGQVVVHGEDLALSAWLTDTFVRHFPEVEGLAWPSPTFVEEHVEVSIDLSTGMLATTSDLEIRASDVMDRRRFSTDEFQLGNAEHSLSLVVAPCRRGTISHSGEPIAGVPIVEDGPRPGSSAFLAIAEVWSR